MFPSQHRAVRILHLLRDNALNILAFSCFIVIPFSTTASVIIAIFILYFINCQFKNLPFHHFFRRWGYDCFFLQYFDAVIIGTNIGRELVDRRLHYRVDYILMGYHEFKAYCIEMSQLNSKNKDMNELYENCYN